MTRHVNNWGTSTFTSALGKEEASELGWNNRYESCFDTGSEESTYFEMCSTIMTTTTTTMKMTMMMMMRFLTFYLRTNGAQVLSDRQTPIFQCERKRKINNMNQISVYKIGCETFTSWLNHDCGRIRVRINVRYHMSVFSFSMHAFHT